MVIVTRFDIGDTVRCGPIDEAMVTTINFAVVVTYTLTYWIDRTAVNYTAWDWELELIKKSEVRNEGVK